MYDVIHSDDVFWRTAKWVGLCLWAVIMFVTFILVAVHVTEKPPLTCSKDNPVYMIRPETVHDADGAYTYNIVICRNGLSFPTAIQ